MLEALGSISSTEKEFKKKYVCVFSVQQPFLVSLHHYIFLRSYSMDAV
jgi:hypothetical protein